MNWRKRFILQWRNYFAGKVRRHEHKQHSLSQGCAVCRGKASSEALSGICSLCWGKISWIKQVCCPHCGRAEACMDCVARRENETFLLCQRSAVQYDTLMKEWLSRYKYRGDERLEPALGGMLQHAYHLLADAQLQHNDSHGFDWISYVPVSEERMIERGFNQAERLARHLALYTGLQVIPLLERTRDTAKQSFRGRHARMAAMNGVFVLKQAVLQRIERVWQEGSKPNIILVDDVYTTGSTLNECAKTIKQHKEASIYGLTLAR